MPRKVSGRNEAGRERTARYRQRLRSTGTPEASAVDVAVSATVSATAESPKAALQRLQKATRRRGGLAAVAEKAAAKLGTPLTELDREQSPSAGDVEAAHAVLRAVSGCGAEGPSGGAAQGFDRADVALGSALAAAPSWMVAQRVAYAVLAVDRAARYAGRQAPKKRFRRRLVGRLDRTHAVRRRDLKRPVVVPPGGLHSPSRTPGPPLDPILAAGLRIPA